MASDANTEVLKKEHFTGLSLVNNRPQQVR
jgi:hypothetical protein